jgi:hypothetical protein
MLCIASYFILAIQDTKANTNQSNVTQIQMINGMWEVESFIKGKKNKGIAYIFNDFGNNIKGFVELKRLPILLKLTGTIQGLNINLTAESNKFKLSSTAIINPENNTVSGSYIASPNNLKVKWTGKKIKANIKKGSYKYNKKSKQLSLTLNDGTSPVYTVLNLTSISLKFNSGQEWKRPASNPQSILGAWESTIKDKQYVMVLCDDNMVHLIIRDKYDAPPAKDMSGQWYVSSIQNNVSRTGRAFIHMEPSGLVSGFAELTSLPGLSTIIGKMSDFKFMLNLKSPKGRMTVEGFANDFSSIVSGSYHLDGTNKSISWAGKKISRTVKKGRYSYDQQSKALTTVLENNQSKKYQIKKISKKQMVFIDATIWKRNSGDKDSIIGVWENSIKDNHQSIVFFKNKKLMILEYE